MSTEKIEIKIPDQLFEEIIDNAAIGMGYRAQSSVRTEDGKTATITEKRTKREFVTEFLTTTLKNHYKAGLRREAQVVAIKKSEEDAKEKLDSF